MRRRAMTAISPHRRLTVRDDWRAWLPTEKAELFTVLLTQLESPYSMLSVSLNEAIALRKAGRHGTSREAVGVTEKLCTRMVATLALLLSRLVGYAKHFGVVPNVAPLNPENFHGRREQRLARTNSLLNRVLLSQRSQFLHKIATLDEMVMDLEKEFRESAGELSEHTAIDPDHMWMVLDSNHYDLNTCLRETIVLLKSFIIALPDNQLAGFSNALQPAAEAYKRRASSAEVFQHRRTEQIAAE